jgi:hypothetical protein
VIGDAQAENGASSRLHWYVAPTGSVEPSLKVSEVTVCRAPSPGPTVGSRTVSGATVSTTQLTLAAGSLGLAFGLNAVTWKVWPPSVRSLNVTVPLWAAAVNAQGLTTPSSRHCTEVPTKLE